LELPKKIAQLFAAERERLPLWTPVLLGTGIGLYYAMPYEPRYWQPLSALILLLSLILLSRRRVALRTAVIAALLVAVGFSAAYWRTQNVAAPILHKILYFRTIEGQIDDIRIKPDGKTIVLSHLAIEDVRERITPARISISLKKPALDIVIGDRVRVKAMLFPPPTPAMPGGYDFARGFYYDRLGAVGFSPYAPEIIMHTSSDNFDTMLSDLRLNLAQRIQSYMSEETGPVAAAMMVGEDSAVTDEVKDAMRDAGIYHVLSISGLHMALAVGLVYMAVRLLLSLYMPLALRLPVKKIAACVGLVSAFAYLLLAGYPVPAVRSFVMVGCVMIAILFDRRGISLYSLAWAATLILLFVPESLLGASFQLSFAATMAIIALYERYAVQLYAGGRGIVHTVAVYFIGIAATSLVASLATTPLVIYHFNRFTVWGIVANMLMVPLASFWIMPAAVLAFLLMPFGAEGWALALLDKGITLMVEGSKWFASLPYANFSLSSPSFAGFLLMIYGGLWLCLWKQKWRLAGAPAIIIGVLTLLVYKPYDIWISDDATRVMVKLENGEYLFVRGRETSFDAETWLRAAGRESALTLKDSDAFTCDDMRCVGTVQGRRVAVAKRKDATNICTGEPDIVITSDWLKGSCISPLVLDGQTLEENGAVGLRILPNDIAIDTAMAYRGRRPWVSLPYSLYVKEKAAMMEKNRGDDDN
jgi:competence protein ComEC